MNMKPLTEQTHKPKVPVLSVPYALLQNYKTATAVVIAYLFDLQEYKRAQNTGYPRPSLKKISVETGLSVRTVQRAIQDAERQNALKVFSRYENHIQTRSEYRVILNVHTLPLTLGQNDHLSSELSATSKRRTYINHVDEIPAMTKRRTVISKEDMSDRTRSITHAHTIAAMHTPNPQSGLAATQLCKQCGKQKENTRLKSILCGACDKTQRNRRAQRNRNNNPSPCNGAESTPPIPPPPPRRKALTFQEQRQRDAEERKQIEAEAFAKYGNLQTPESANQSPTSME